MVFEFCSFPRKMTWIATYDGENIGKVYAKVIKKFLSIHLTHYDNFIGCSLSWDTFGGSTKDNN